MGGGVGGVGGVVGGVGGLGGVSGLEGRNMTYCSAVTGLEWGRTCTYTSRVLGGQKLTGRKLWRIGMTR